jgi:hypothetical protein
VFVAALPVVIRTDPTPVLIVVDPPAVISTAANDGLIPATRAAFTVPLARFVAFKAVRLTPLAAGNVAGNLASGIVPAVRFVALNAVRSGAYVMVLPDLVRVPFGNFSVKGPLILTVPFAVCSVITAPGSCPATLQKDANASSRGIIIINANCFLTFDSP